MNAVRCFVNYVIFREFCDRMRFEVDCAKSHHRVIPEGLIKGVVKIVTAAGVIVLAVTVSIFPQWL